MKGSEIEVLRRCLGKYRMVRITRAIPSFRHMHGFVLGLSDALVLVHKFNDFYPEGCSVIRLQDVEAVRSGENERFWEKMFAGEGLLDAIGISAPPPLADMETVLEALRAAGRPAIVEAEALEDEDEDDEVFLIGRIVRVVDDECWVQHFDALGQWDEEPTSIDVPLITHVQIEAPYLETYIRYAPPFPD